LKGENWQHENWGKTTGVVPWPPLATCACQAEAARPLAKTKTRAASGAQIAAPVTAFAAPLIGLQFKIGLLVAATAMAGDLLSSFLKRRFDLAPSTKATGLDQIPEALFPLLACRSALSLTAIDIATGCIIFFIGAVLFSRLFFRLGLRDRPY
jgi:CDP-2,3-bis-(O-geranylgeranyl)-sn-glycerol synthase